MLTVKCQISIAEANCLIEAITAANKAVVNGQVVYAADGYQSEKLSEQLSYASVTAAIAEELRQMIELEEQTLIVFEP